MRYARLGLIVSAVVALGALVSLDGERRSAAEPKTAAPKAKEDVLRVVERGDGDEIFARFDRPVVEPSAIGSQAPLDVDFPGRAIWTGVARATFFPETPFPPSRIINVKVADVAALDGVRLKEPVSWQVMTTGLEIERWDLPTVTERWPGFELKFNHPVRASKLPLGAWFERLEGEKKTKVYTLVNGHMVSPMKKLPLGSQWTLVVDGQLAAEDGAKLKDTFRHAFRVCSQPRLEEAYGISSLSDPETIHLSFNNPLREKNARPSVSTQPSAEFTSSIRGSDLILTGKFLPGTTYWVRLAPGLKDEYGNPLDAVTAVVHMPGYDSLLTFQDRAQFVERHGRRSVRLFSVNVPTSRVALNRLFMTPWIRDEAETVLERSIVSNSEPNECFIHGIPLPGPGYYEIEADSLESRRYTERTYQVTDLALTFKLGRERSLACVSSFDTAAPVAGVELTLHDEKGAELWRGRTSADGCAEAPGRPELAKTPQYLIARTGDDGAWIDLDDEELSMWRLGLDTESPSTQDPLPIYLFTDRPIYRPGETVNVKGWLKDATERSLKFELRDESNELIDTVSCDISPMGGFSASFPLGSQTYGTWTVVARVGDRSAEKDFEIAWYRAPSFEVRVRPCAPHYFPNDQLEATVEGHTFFGAPLAGARVHWWAHVGDEGDHCDGEGVLDAKGRMKFGYKLGDGAGTLTLEATVTDASNQSISNETEVPIYPAAVRIKATCDQRVGEVGKPLAFNLEATRLDGTREDRPLSVRFLRRTWSSVQQRTAGGGWSHVEDCRDDLVADHVVLFGSWKATPVAAGSHILEVRTKDAAGREVLETLEIDVAGPGEAGWPRRNDHAVDLIPDREQYAVGDTARILLRGALPKSRALVTIEGEGVAGRRWVDVAGDSCVIEVPVTASFAPNVHVGVLDVRGRTTRELTKEGEDPGRPAMRYGYATIAVDTTNRRLPVNVKVAPRCAPGAEVEVEVVTAPCAEVTLAVVDQAVLSLLDEPDPDPHAFFWAPRPLRVETADARPDVVANAPMNIRGKKGRPGGGGGGPSWRRNFRGTAYWNACLCADVNGHVKTSFRMPDNLTRWRVIAVAATTSRWGTGVATFETHKPLMLVSALPRFALLGDSFAARVIVHNRTGAAGRVRVELDGVAQEVDVEDGRSAPVDFQVTADRPGPRRFAFRATLRGSEDLLEVTVPVRYPGALETLLVSGRIEGASDVTLPSMPHVEGVTLSLAPSEAALMDAQLRKLLDYPHGCVEQTTSKLLPLLGLSKLLPDEKAKEWIDLGVARLLSMQTRSGGFAYWPGGSQPHPTGSIYATHGLVLARREGYKVPVAALDRALKYVEEGLRRPDSASRSYALYVLSLAGLKLESYLESLPPDSFLTLAAIEMGKTERARQTLRAPVLVSTGDDFHSHIRKDATWFMACTKLGEDPGMRAADLLSSAHATYESAWALLALAEGMRASPQRHVRVWIDGRRIADQTVDRVLRIEIPSGRLRIENDGTIYYAAAVRGCRGEQGPIDKGFWMRRTYTRVGETVPRLDFNAGDLVVVRVSLWLRDARRYVAIEDPLPAGFEPVDLRFATERRRDVGGDFFDWIERKDDRVFASDQWMNMGLYELVYLARATTAGRFSAPAPLAEEMYAPDARGLGEASTVVVK